MNISLLLKMMLKQVSSRRTPKRIISNETMKNIQQIQSICNKEFYDQSFYGAGALNRKILLDQRIANLLTPETIIAILTIHAQTEKIDRNSNIAIYRNSSGYASLASVLFYGFFDGEEIIRLMPNNDKRFGPKKYADQKNNYAKNTIKIISNIKKAAQLIDFDPTDYQYQNELIADNTPLLQKFNKITQTIDEIKQDNKSHQLLSVPGYTAKEIREQSIHGFVTICKLLKIKYKKSNDSISIEPPTTLETLVNQFLSSEKVLLNGTVIHFFYDRAHLQALIEQDTKIIIGEKIYRFRDILRQMISQCDRSDNTVCDTAKEQFKTRLKLVESHLQTNFPAYFHDENITDDNLPFGYSKIKFLIKLFDNEIEKGIWAFTNVDDLRHKKYFLEKMLELYDDSKGALTLKQCMISIRRLDPEGYNQLLKEFGLNFVFTILSTDKLGDFRGPKILNQASLELNKLIQLSFCDNYKSIQYSYNSLAELEIIIDGQYFNITQILEHEPDFADIHFSNEQLDQYARFTIKEAQIKTCLNSLSGLEILNSIPKKEDDSLHLGHKLAISIYSSTSGYTKIQDFLRSAGQSDSTQKIVKNNPKLIQEILLHICVAAQGIAKSSPNLPKHSTQKHIRRTIRKEFVTNDDHFLKQRFSCKKSQQTLREKGFTSTSEPGAKFSLACPNVYTVFHEEHADTVGKNIASLSLHPDEKEVVYAPGTRFQYTDYMNVNGNHLFAVTPVTGLNKNFMDYSANKKAQHQLKIINKQLEIHLEKNKHSFVRKLFDTVSNDDKLSCIQVAKDCVANILLNSPNDYLQAFETFKSILQDALKKNATLVSQAKLKASLGNTYDTLQSVLQRVNYSIKILNDSIMENPNPLQSQPETNLVANSI